MATHNIDIAIDTGRTKTELDRVNDSLQKTERNAIGAAKAANQLTMGSEEVAKANLKLAQSQLKLIANDVAQLQAARKNLEVISENIIARQQQATSISEINRLEKQLESVYNSMATVERDYTNATQELTRAQLNYNEAVKPVVDLERRKKELIQQSNAAVKQAEQAQRQQATATANAKRSNDQLVQSLRNQLEITKRGGIEGKIYQNQLKLNSQATKEQRQEVERLTRELDKMNSKQSSGGGLSVGRLAAGAGLVFGATQILQWGKDALTTADNMATLQVRIRATASTQEEANATFAQLVKLANTMGTSLESTANAYSRFAPYAARLGASQTDVVKFIDTLNKLGQVGGASAQEVDSAIYQMSQSFAAGKLQGQEFSIVAKSMPNVLDELARVMGVTRGELSKLSSEGKITAQDLLKLKDGSEELDDAFGKLPRSIEQASQGLSNQLSVAIDLINQKFGITAGIAAQMDGWAQTVGRFNQYLSGSWSETDNLNKQLGILQNNQKELVNIQSQAEKGSMKFNYATKSLVSNLQEQAVISAKIAALQSQIKEQPKPAYVQPDDPEAAKRISDLQFEIKLRGMNAEAAAREKAIRNAPSTATPEQVKELGDLAVELYRVEQAQKEATKAGKDGERQARRNAEELRKNQEANQKYIDELTATNDKYKNELDTAKSMIGTNLTLGKSVDDLVFQYKNLTEIKFQNNLLSSQAESLAKLNSDATDEEKEKVIELTEALERQKIAKELAQQVSKIQGDLQSELGDPFELELQKITDQEAQRLAVIQQARQAQLISEEEFESQRTQIAQSAAEQREAFERKSMQTVVTSVGSAVDASLDLMRGYQAEQTGIFKAMFIASKAAAIANALIAMQENIAQSSKIGFPWNIASIAAATAQGISIVGNIRSISEQFADGGYVSGRGTGRSDEIPALLSNGEYVATSKATRRYRPQLEAMNRGTYSEDGGSRPVNIEIINTTGARVTTQQLTEDDVRVIIGEEVPDLVGAQMQDPYSPLFRATQSSFKVERNV